MRSPSIKATTLRIADHVRLKLQPYAHARWGCAPPISDLLPLRDWLRNLLEPLSFDAAEEEYEEYFLPLFDALAFITEGSHFGMVERMRINSAYALVCGLVQRAKPEPKFNGRKRRSRS